MIKYKYIFQTKYTEAILSNCSRKLLWLEITKMLIAVFFKFVLFIIISGTVSFPIIYTVAIEGWLKTTQKWHRGEIVLYTSHSLQGLKETSDKNRFQCQSLYPHTFSAARILICLPDNEILSPCTYAVCRLSCI